MLLSLKPVEYLTNIFEFNEYYYDYHNETQYEVEFLYGDDGKKISTDIEVSYHYIGEEDTYSTPGWCKTVIDSVYISNERMYDDDDNEYEIDNNLRLALEKEIENQLKEEYRL